MHNKKMKMGKLNLKFTMLPIDKERANEIGSSSITTCDNCSYMVSEKWQSMEKHDELKEIYNRIKTALNKLSTQSMYYIKRGIEIKIIQNNP